MTTVMKNRGVKIGLMGTRRMLYIFYILFVFTPIIEKGDSDDDDNDVLIILVSIVIALLACCLVALILAIICLYRL